MKFDENDLKKAKENGIISEDVLNNLMRFLKSLYASKILNEPTEETQKTIQPASTKVFEPKQPSKPRKFTIENFLYYFGAIIIINTMGWYMGNVWEKFQHGGLLAICVVYFLIFLFLGNFLWKKDKKTPGGLLYVCAVSIVPLATWAFETLIGIMPKDLNEYSDYHILIRSGWILMELATIGVGLLFLKYRKFPFLTLPICYSLWYLSMDITPLCMAQVMSPTWGMRNFATFVFAILMLGFALKYDKKTDEDFSFWLYLFGSSMLWCVIGSIFMQFKWSNEFAYFGYALFSFLYMIVSILIQRKVFMVWGTIGALGYLGHLAYNLFKDTAIFPIAMTGLGLLIIFAGIYYSKNCEKIETKLRNLIFGK